jgi:hypothetical protein
MMDLRELRGSQPNLPSPGAGMAGPRGPLGWWLQLTAQLDVPQSAGFAVRDRARRGRLVSVFLLVFLVVELGGFYQYRVVDDDHPLMVTVLGVALGVLLVAGVLNRLGQVGLAGLLLVGVADLLPLAGVHATAIGGRLDVLHLAAFYLLVGSEIVAASVLAPWSVFPVALANGVLADATIALTRPTPALAAVLASNNAQQVYAGPLLMQLIIALVAYLWARSTLTALGRADRAEEIALLERREIERTRELEEGVQQLLEVHVQLANGNFSVRAPSVRNPLLWQVGSSLNNLIARFARLGHIEFVLRRTQEEAHRLAEGVLAMRAGRRAVWPAPSGTLLDEVIVALTGGAPRPADPRASVPNLRPGQAREPGWAAASTPQLPDGPSTADLPDWLRQTLGSE